MMDTLSGYWILKIPGKGKQRSKFFPCEKHVYPEGTKVSVAAYTRKAGKITRIPFVISFRYEKNDNNTENNILNIIELLSKAFKIYLVLATSYEVNGFIYEIYIYDDIKICKALDINHDLYLEQNEIFNFIIGKLIKYFYPIEFTILKNDALIPINQNIKITSISIKKDKIYLKNVFSKLINDVSEGINCHYIENFNISIFNKGLVNALLILKEFKEIKYKILYRIYANLEYEYNISNLINKRTKIIKSPKWNCKKDCSCYCGLTSPLHSIIDEIKGVDENYHKVREHNQIPKFKNIDDFVILFGGCHLLNNTKFIINDNQFHMGALGFILPDGKSNQKEIEKIFLSDNEIFCDIQSDIESRDIRTIQKDKINSSILSFSSESSFIKLLIRRGENYRKKIKALIDSQPFITSKYKNRQGKLNILQFLDYKEFNTIFSYEPLHNLGFLERALICRDLRLNTQYVVESLQRIAQFSTQPISSIRINIDFNKFKKKYSYVYKPCLTIFTRKGLENFYTTTAVKFSIIYTILENDSLNAENFCINDDVIEKSSLKSNMILAYRDNLLIRHTEKSTLKKSLKKYFEGYPTTFIYHREIERKFSSYSKSLLNIVIDEMIQNSLLVRIITHNINNKKIIIYQVNKNKT